MLPSTDRMRTRMPTPRTVHKGVDLVAHDAVGKWMGRGTLSGLLMKRAEQIERCSRTFDDWSDEQVNSEFQKCRREFQYAQADAGHVDGLLAILSEISARVLGMRPYGVQIMGALVLHHRALAEMATGEGKSLTTGIGAALMACLAKPVHVLSSNDYLAERDCEEMKPFFDALGFSSTSISSETPFDARAPLYKADIVYTTGKELLGDFLRDRLALGVRVNEVDRAIEHVLLGHQNDGLTMRGLHSVLVDEADSVLIDEAVTPLILSAPRENMSLNEVTVLARDLSEQFVQNRDYSINRRDREILWSAEGLSKLEKCAGDLPLMWQGQERSQEIMTLALQAKELFLKGEHYVVQEDKVVLLDTLTGRLTPNRNLGIGLQQAVEAKEGLEINPPTETLARFSYQKFFRLIPHLAGMSGTLQEAKRELWQIYHLPIINVPTHRPIQRKLLPWKIFLSEAEKIEALVEEACRIRESGQPVLIGTRTVAQSEELAQRIQEKGVACEVLNAARHEEEADIVARAGQDGALTIATNMAGRGTDIKLPPAVKDKGGLCVLSLEPQDSARVDRQLFGRSGRQGDPGCVRVYASFEDSIVKRFCSKPVWFGYRLLFVLRKKSFEGLIDRLQASAERYAMKQRLSILKSDIWYENYLSFPGAERRRSQHLEKGEVRR